MRKIKKRLDTQKRKVSLHKKQKNKIPVTGRSLFVCMRKD